MIRLSLALAMALTLAAPAREALADAQEYAAWRMATRLNGVEDYRAFLAKHPAGNFAAFAHNRIAAAEGPRPAAPLVAAPLAPPSESGAAPETAPTGLNLSPGQRMAARDGLRARGFDPGPGEGAFDEAARATIRAWQAASGFPPTGELTEAEYDELTAAPLSGALPAGAPMTARLDPGTEGARAAAEAALFYGPEELAEIEMRLARAGFAVGEADGTLDEAARSAIHDFRLSRGLAPHGFLDRPAVDLLMRATASWPGPVAAKR
ncbi:MAG: peptidoglycan-binding domain-containing protein [Pikeienuella sp.]|uniref:peptidoglycan-binding domain-containing protein n=1 Tax=Pikeienuella sp. TaxID=2831957 RepID=UPI00391A8BC8